ncbi:MAG: formylmethanofuran dehydrogenase subunit C [Gammaproteobacteria bacterium]
MTNTTVTFNGLASARIDMRWLSEAITQSYSADQAKKLTLPVGNKKIEVGELFDISDNFNNNTALLEGCTPKLDHVGHALPKDALLTVNGDCGHYLGAQLAGGKVIITGNTLDFAGCSMRAGMIEIKGNCADYLGGALPGHKKGIAGGTILVHGNAGNFTGDLMRRGIIMVTGNIGDYCGSRMIAGTITNLGKIGKQAGMGMRRGTLLLPELPEDMASTFTNCGRHNLGYLTLLLHQLRAHDSEFKSLHSMRRRVQKYMGDTSVGGLGEILIWIG